MASPAPRLAVGQMQAWTHSHRPSRRAPYDVETMEALINVVKPMAEAVPVGS